MSRSRLADDVRIGVGSFVVAVAIVFGLVLLLS
jgi:hypothetical protein